MLRVTGHSKKLLEEHLALAEKHFPGEEALETYLGKRGIALERNALGGTVQMSVGICKLRSCLMSV